MMVLLNGVYILDYCVLLYISISFLDGYTIAVLQTRKDELKAVIKEEKFDCPSQRSTRYFEGMAVYRL